MGRRGSASYIYIPIFETLDIIKYYYMNLACIMYNRLHRIGIAPLVIQNNRFLGIMPPSPCAEQ